MSFEFNKTGVFPFFNPLNWFSLACVSITLLYFSAQLFGHS
nr:MAG TPA: hypothetical protein [Caudoviricetes sp.]